MNKEFLGLGIIFKGVDKGLDDSLDRAQHGFEKTTESLYRLEKSASFGGNAFSGLMDSFKMLSIARIGNTLEEIAHGIAGTDKTFSELSKVLDTTQAKFSQVFDPAMAQNLNANLIKTIATTGISAEQAQEIALGMTNFGRSAKEASQELPFMGKMVGLLGLDASKVAEMFGQGLSTLRATPEAMEKLVKETVKMGKAYNLTGQVEILPELFDTVTQNAARFGIVSADAAIRTTMGLSQMVAGFRKVGLSQQGALNAAVGFNKKLGEMQNSVRDMEVGLGPMDQSVLDLAQALSLAGVTDPFSTIKEGFKDPQSLIKTIGDQLEGLDSFTQQAVTQRLRRIFGDDITNMVSTYRDDIKGAVKQADVQAEKMGSADIAFKKTTDAMLGTMDVQERLTQTAKDLLQVQIDFANKTDVLNQLARERKAFGELSVEIGKGESMLSKLILTLDKFKKTGIAGLFSSDFLTKLSIVGGLLGGLIFPLTAVFGGISALWNLTKGIGAVLMMPFQLLFSAISLLVSPLTKLPSLLMTVGSASIGASSKGVSLLGSSFKMLSKTITDHIKVGGALLSDYFGKVKKTMSSVGKVFMDPFMESFSKASGKSFEKVNSGLSTLSGSLSKGVSSLKDYAMRGLSPVIDKMLIFTNRVAGMANAVWSFVTKPIVALANGLKTAAMSLLNFALAPVKMFMSAIASMTTAALRFAGTILGTVVGAIQAMGAALLANPVGLTIAAVVALGAAIAATIYYWDDITKAISDFFDWTATTFPEFTSMVVKSWEMIKNGAMAAWDFTVNMFNAGMDGLKNIFSGGIAFINSVIAAFNTGGFTAAWDLIKTKAVEAFDTVTAKINEVWTNVSNFFANMKAGVANVSQIIMDSFKSAFAFLHDGLIKALDFGAVLKDVFSAKGAVGVFDFLVEAASNAVEKIAVMLKKAISNFALPDWASKIIFGESGREKGTPTDNAVPNNVIDFQKAKDWLKDHNIPMPQIGSEQPSSTGEPKVFTQVQQPGAPKARQPLNIPFEEKRTVSDQNFQALLDEMRGLRESIIDALKGIADRDVNVTITGDMKKIFKAVRDEQNDIAGGRGIGHAVTR